MNDNLARSIEIIEYVASHFTDSAAGLVARPRDEGDARALALLAGPAGEVLR